MKRISFFLPFFRLSLSSKCPDIQAEEMFHLISSSLTSLILFLPFSKLGFLCQHRLLWFWLAFYITSALPGWAEQRVSCSWTHYVVLKYWSYKLNAAIIVLFSCLYHAVPLTAGQSPYFSFYFAENLTVTIWVISTLWHLSFRMKFSIWTLQPPARYQLPSRLVNHL